MRSPIPLLVTLVAVLCVCTSSSTTRLTRPHATDPAHTRAPPSTATTKDFGPRTFVLGLSDGLKNGLASGLAAACVKALLQPFDTIKTVQQASGARLGPLAALQKVMSDRGVQGLYSGLGVTVVGSAPSVAVYFGCYSVAKRHLVALLPARFRLLGIALAAAYGNTLASVFRVPYEVIKQRLQAGQYTSTLQAMTIIIRGGPSHVLSLWGGGRLTSQIIRDVPYAIVTLCVYELLQSLHTHSQSEPVSSAAKSMRDAQWGALAGGIGSLATTPMDVVKTRMMTSSDYGTYVQCVLSILSKEGPATFLTGAGPRLMHKIPANGLFFLCYELFRRFLKVKS